jgi:diguanylate cyclase (GGDEF)-like protein
MMGIFPLLEMRREALDRAHESMDNLTLLLDRSITRNLKSYELSMQAVTEGIQNSEVMRLPPLLRQRLLFDRSINAEDMGAILVSDANGRLLLDSRSTPPRPFSVEDRDYFLVHRENSIPGLYVSRSFEPRETNESTSIGLSRRLENTDGSFAGIVVGTLRLDYFRHLFEGVQLGENGSLTLIREDGIVLMQRPYDASLVGRQLTGDSPFLQMTIQGGSIDSEAGPFDNVKRIYSSARVNGYPLVIVVGRSLTNVLAAWRKRCILFSAFIALVDATIIVMSIGLAHQWKRRNQFQQRLETMVETDELTGLASRRALDDRSDMEWRRALRESTPLSLLMIDVDNFKAYNDHYGHLAGDDALAAVGRCIDTSIRRPGDLAARYGGEEFAVLLPNTPTQGAVAIGEAIRHTLHRRGIVHAASPIGIVTVSIGVSTIVTQKEFENSRMFFQAADSALYRAKMDGRDRIIIYGAS